MVKQQEQPNSCAIACVAMTNYKMKKGWIAAGVAAEAALTVAVPVFGSFIGAELMHEAVDAAIRSEPEVYKIYGEVTGSLYDGSTKTDLPMIPEVLRRLNCGDWEVQVVPPAQAGKYIAAAAAQGPVIAAVQQLNGSAHAVVVDGVAGSGDGSVLFVCDPGDGLVHVTEASEGSGVIYRDVAFFNGHFCALKYGGSAYNPAS